MRAHLLALALVVPALAACSGGGEPVADDASLAAQDLDKEWQDAAGKVLGVDPDLETLKRQAAVDCQRTDVTNWIVALGTGGDTSTADVTRIGLQHVCPDVENAFAQALEQVEAASDVNALVCAQPVAQLDSVSRMKLDFVC